MIRTLCTRLNAAVFVSIWTMVVSTPLWIAEAVSAQACERGQKITASDGAQAAAFGYSVAISGDTAIVGARYDNDFGFSSGSAYVFVRSGTVWSQQQKLTASDGASFQEFGNAVAISGNTAIVGALYDAQLGTNSGAAYVFVRSGTVWTQQQKLTASDGAAFDVFGISVAISGDTVMAGALGNAFPAQGRGFAYVFVRSGTVWTQQQKIAALDGAPNDLFGFSSVSIAGDTAIMGAREDNDLGSNSGSAYIFVRSGTVWTQQQKLLPSDGAADDEFGSSASISGDTVIVGAHRDDDTASSSGSAYVFVRSGTVWTQQQKLTASDAQLNDWFGVSVSISGDAAIVGALFDDDLATNSGAAYLFTRAGTVWTQQQKLTASDGAAEDWFGRSVAISGDTAIAGGENNDDVVSNSGSAYIFECPSDPPSAADIDGDGDVDIDDLFTVIAAWGPCPKPCPPYCEADIDDDCNVEIDDLFAVIAAWGS